MDKATNEKLRVQAEVMRLCALLLETIRLRLYKRAAEFARLIKNHLIVNAQYLEDEQIKVLQETLEDAYKLLGRKKK